MFPPPILIPPTAPHSSSGVGTIGQIAADIPSGISLTPPQEFRKLAYYYYNYYYCLISWLVTWEGLMNIQTYSIFGSKTS
jgi:hypothetical protein